MSIPQIGYCEPFTVVYFRESHGKFGDCTLLLLLIGDVENGGIGNYLADRTSWGRKEVEEETEGDAEGEAIPELCDWVGGLTKVTVWGRQDKEVGEIRDAHETSTQGGALLVERGGCGGGLVEDVVISDGCFNYEAGVGDNRFFAAGGVGHDDGKKKREGSGSEKRKKREGNTADGQRDEYLLLAGESAGNLSTNPR